MDGCHEQWFTQILRNIQEGDYFIKASTPKEAPKPAGNEAHIMLNARCHEDICNLQFDV